MKGDKSKVARRKIRAEREAEKTKEGAFSVKVGGLLFERREDHIVVVKGHRARKVCRWIEFLAEVHEVDSTEVKIKVRFIGQDGEEVTLYVPKAELHSAFAISQRLLNHGYEICRDSEFRKLFPVLWRKRRPRNMVRVTDRPGWHELGQKLIYVTSGWAASDASDDGAPEIELLSQAGSVTSVKGKVSEWKEAVAGPCEGSSRPVFAICAAFAAPTLYLLAESNLGFSFVGPSSTGKSTAVSAAASVFGDPGQYAMSWHATENALAMVAYGNNDGLLVLEELGEARAEAVARAFYSLQHGRGKLRLDSGRQLEKSAAFRAVILSTGELGITDLMRDAASQARQGQTIRLLGIPVPDSTMFAKLHGHETKAALVDKLQLSASRLHGAVGKRWARHLIEERSAAVKTITRLRAQTLEELLKAAPEGLLPNIVARAASSFALVGAVGEYAIRCGLLPWDAGQAVWAAKGCFKGWAKYALEHESPALGDPLGAVRLFLQSHSGNKFAPLDEYDDVKRPVLAGYDHVLKGTPVFLIFPEFFRQRVCGRLSPAVVANALRAEGYLIANGRGGAVKQIRIPNSKTRIGFYVVSKAILES